jgi:hypothetical protein
MSELKISNTNQDKVYKIVIKKQTIVLEIERTDLVEVKETGDGIVFNLQGGLHLSLIDMNMPLEVKRVIYTACNSFKKANLVIDLMSYLKPVKATSE